MAQGNIYDAFVDGMRKGWKVATLNMLPNVVLAFVLIKALKLSGLLDLLGQCFAPVMAIFGLPGESEADMLESVRQVAALRPDQVKIHLLHVLRHTVLGNMFERGEYVPMERADYIQTVVRALELLPPDTVIARLTGDGLSDDLLAPDWSRKKTTVINDIDKLMYTQKTYQGRLFK